MSLNDFCAALINGDLDTEIAQLSKDADEQKEWSHPLKMERAAKFHKLGAFNAKAVELINGLKEHLKTGEGLNVD